MSKHSPESLALGAVRSIVAEMAKAKVSDEERLRNIAFILATYEQGFVADRERSSDAYITRKAATSKRADDETSHYRCDV